METMQQEAIRRVKEMQKKAQSYVKQDEPQKFETPKSSTSTNNTKNKQENHTNQQSEKVHNNQSHQANNPQHKNNQQNRRPNMANPFAQLFGSNMSGFNRYKESPQNKPPQMEKAFQKNEHEHLV